MVTKHQGFFVKIKEGGYSQAYVTLNEARTEARSIGPDLLIYHGILTMNDDGTIDDSQLYLVPKPWRGDRAV